MSKNWVSYSYNNNQIMHIACIIIDTTAIIKRNEFKNNKNIDIVAFYI